MSLSPRVAHIVSSMIHHKPATIESVRIAEQHLNIKLPATYVSLLLHSNGVEGFLSDTAYLCLWSVESLSSLNDAYPVQEFLPKYILIGTDGSNTGFLLSRRTGDPAVYTTPLVGMPDRDIQCCAPDICTMIERLADASS